MGGSSAQGNPRQRRHPYAKPRTHRVFKGINICTYENVFYVLFDVILGYNGCSKAILIVFKIGYFTEVFTFVAVGEYFFFIV